MNASRDKSPSDDGGDQCPPSAPLAVVKLTIRQRQLLSDLKAGELVVADTYPPAAALVDKGFAEYREGKWGASRLAITDVGRAALAKADPQ